MYMNICIYIYIYAYTPQQTTVHIYNTYTYVYIYMCKCEMIYDLAYILIFENKQTDAMAERVHLVFLGLFVGGPFLGLTTL